MIWGYHYFRKHPNDFLLLHFPHFVGFSAMISTKIQARQVQAALGRQVAQLSGMRCHLSRGGFEGGGLKQPGSNWRNGIRFFFLGGCKMSSPLFFKWEKLEKSEAPELLLLYILFHIYHIIIYVYYHPSLSEIILG